MTKTLIALALAMLLAAPAFADEWDVDNAPKSEATEGSGQSSQAAAKADKSAVKADHSPAKSDLSNAKADKASAKADKAAAKAEKVAAKQRAKQAKLEAKGKAKGSQDAQRPPVGSYFGNGDEYIDSGAPEAPQESDQQPAPDDLLNPQSAGSTGGQPADAGTAPANQDIEAANSATPSDQTVPVDGSEAAPADAPSGSTVSGTAPDKGLEHYSSYPAMKGRAKDKGKHGAHQADDSEDSPNLAETATGDDPAPKDKKNAHHDDPGEW